MKSYRKYSKATICRHMVKKILVIWFLIKGNKVKGDQQSFWTDKRGIRQAKVLQEEVENFSVKRVMVGAGIPPSVSTATVRRVMRKAGLKWNHAQKKGLLTKSDLKLRLKFARKVRRKLPKDFWTKVSDFIWMAQVLHAK